METIILRTLKLLTPIGCLISTTDAKIYLYNERLSLSIKQFITSQNTEASAGLRAEAQMHGSPLGLLNLFPSGDRGFESHPRRSFICPESINSAFLSPLVRNKNAHQLHLSVFPDGHREGIFAPMHLQNI